MVGLVPATPLRGAAPCHMIGVAGSSPAMTAVVAARHPTIHKTKRPRRNQRHGRAGEGTAGARRTGWGLGGVPREFNPS
jgi:hypothetical protein